MTEQLRVAIEALAAVDWTALDPAELHDTLVDMHRLHGRLTAVRAEATAAWDSRGVWSWDGSKSPAARLGRDCSLAHSTARREVRRARALRSMPFTAAALAAGKLSVDQADELVHANQPAVAALFARDEQELVAHAGRLRFADFRRCVTYWRHCADDAIAEDRADHQNSIRHFDAVRGFADSVVVQGTLDPVDGSIFLNELERLEQQLFEADWAATRAQHGKHATVDQLPRSATQRRADAIVEMARRSTARGHRVPARPLITVLVGYETFAGRICELADGTVITPGQVLPLLEKADIERVVFDGPKRVIEVGARQRLFTGALRRAIEVRDRRCQHESGCDEPASRCQADHIIEYNDGGPTIQSNGRLLCAKHHRLHHQRTQRPPPEHRAA